jgi:hypothetical protein
MSDRHDDLAQPSSPALAAAAGSGDQGVQHRMLGTCHGARAAKTRADMLPSTG